MTQGISFSGLGSGLDTDSIIRQLTEIERRPIVLIQNRQVRLEQQKSVIQQINSGLLSLRDSSEKLADENLFSIVNVSSQNSQQVSVSATNEAAAGTFTVEVTGLAQARSLSSRSFSSTQEALGLSGEFVIAGRGIDVKSVDTLQDVRDTINDADAGVNAQILTVSSGDNRLIITAQQVGNEGFDIKDASSTDILESLGLISSETTVKNAFANGSRSTKFLDADQAIGTLLNLMSPASGKISIEGQEISIDLSTDSLNDIRDKINAISPTGVTTSVSSNDEGGLTRYQLEIVGTTTILDTSGVLETIGVLNSGGTIRDEIISGAESDTFSSTTTAVGSLLGLGSAPSGEVQIAGTAIAIDLASDSLTDVLSRINDAGISGVAATVNSGADEDGNSQFRLRIGGTTDFIDSGNTLEALGLVVSSNSAFESVARVLTGNATNKQQGVILNPLSNGAKSATLNSDGDPVGPMVGSAVSGSVRIGDKEINVNLNTDSLSDIVDKITAAAPTGITATVDIVGASDFQLVISGTVAFDDPHGVLQALGILSESGTLTGETRFMDVTGANVTNGDTVSISGTNHNGDQVAGTFTITDSNLSVDSLLGTIETLFGSVTASIDSSGRVVVTDNEAGSSALSVSLVANNEGVGSSLSLGTMAITTEGTDARSAELQAGTDALFRINGIDLSRSSNTIVDAVQGLTLNLLEAEQGRLIEIAVTKDDTTELKSSIESFVAEFNSAMDLINQQFVVDEASQTAGPLSGDSTILGLQSRIRSVITGQIEGLQEGFNALVLIGINFDRTGKLQIDDARLTTSLKENLDQVRALFTAQGSATDSGVEFVSSTPRTRAGTYSVNVDQAATRASLIGTEDLSMGLPEGQTVTISQGDESKSALIQLAAGDDTDDIVSKINATLASDVAEERTGSIQNTIDGAVFISSETTFADISGAGVKDGDTIRIQGTTHSGASVSRIFTVEDVNTETVGDLLEAVRDTFNGNVSAVVDDQGRIVVTDNQIGPSSLTVTFVEENEGGGNVNFGSLDRSMGGRYQIEVSASNRDGKLVFEHDSYGSRSRFSITQSLDQLGLTTDEAIGQDVAGTINGETTTGFGRILTGTDENGETDDLALRVSATADDLISTGNDRGSVSVIYGVGRLMTDTLGFITDNIDGTLKNRERAINDTIESLDDQIVAMERRVEQTRTHLVSKFAALEGNLATMQAQGSFLTQQLAGLTAGR